MSTRDDLLAALAQPVGTILSGESLARRLGVSRTMIWKHVRSIKEWGAPVRGNPRTGYEVAGPIDLSLWRLKLKGANRRWIHPHHFFSTASTQSLAKTGADSGMPEGSLWIAERQTSGRGRLQRVWSSSYGGLWMSLLLRPAVPPSQIPSLTEVAALSLAETLSRYLGIEARLKWPNDVGLMTSRGWRKIAGFLTEMSAESDRTHWVVVGLGLNVHNSLPGELRALAITLRELTPVTLQRGEILDRFLANFRGRYQRWKREGFAGFQKEYWRYYRDPAEWVRLNTSQGRVEGRVRGVDGSGALIIESRRQLLRMFEGEIVS